jgi:hypothetical protein
MPYKVWIGNVAVECESVGEVIALAKQADGLAVPGKKQLGAKQIELPNGESRWTEKRVNDFFGQIEGSQKKLIDALLANTEGKTDDQLRRLLSLDGGRALGGVMAGATKNARKVGADPKDLFNKHRVVIDGKKQTEYFLTESFRKVASQVQR